MQGFYLILFVIGLTALPWLGLKLGGRALIAGLGVAEAAAIVGLAWSFRTREIASCGGDELCVSDIASWHDGTGLLFALFLLCIIGASTYIAYALKVAMAEAA